MSRVAPELELTKPGDLSWDYVFVYTKDEKPNAQRQQTINQMRKAGLLLAQMESANKSDVLLLVTATLERFEEQAHQQSIEMKLLPDYQDKLTGSAGYDEFQKEKKHMFAGNELPRFFSSLERQRLLYAIFETEVSQGGCGFNLDDLKILFKVISPLHDYEARDKLYTNWVKRWWTAQPLDDVRDYYGEKVAMYFTFLGHYTLWLGFLSIFGTIAQILQSINHDADHPIVPVYCILLSLWTTFFLESWKRKQSVQAFRWDVQDFEEEERIRPEYVGVQSKGIWVNNHFIKVEEIADSPGFVADEISETKFFPSWKRGLRYLASAPIVLTFLLVTLIGTVAILVFRGILALPAPKGYGKMGQIAGGMLNAFFINVMNIVYKKVAVALNNFENYRTDTAYEDALIVKVFSFQFVNSYISLFYIAFMKEHHISVFGMESGGCRNSCLDEMATQLLSLVVIMQVVGNVKEIAIPMAKAKLKSFLMARKHKKSEKQENELKLTKYEQESVLEPYLSTFDDYNEMAIQFGYVTLFAAAFPIASLASFLNNFIEIRSDAYKLLLHTQRPHYVGCEDIGSWQKVFEVVSTLAVITNVCMIGFTSLILSGKCEFSGNFPIGCGSEHNPCLFYAGDSIRAGQHATSMHLGSHNYTLDCTTQPHHSMCCPSILDGNGEPLIHEISRTLFLSPAAVLWVVVLCEHALLFLRSLLEEVIPDVPSWVQRAQARIDFRKEHALKEKERKEMEKSNQAANDNRKSKRFDQDTTELTTPVAFINPGEHDYYTAK